MVSDDNHNIVIAFMTGYVLHYYKPEDSNWAAINTGCQFDVRNSNLIAREGKIYVLASNGKLEAVDLSGENSATNWLIGAGHGQQYLAESEGELFGSDCREHPTKVYSADLNRLMWVDALWSATVSEQGCSSVVETGGNGVSCIYKKICPRWQYWLLRWSRM